MLPVRVRAGLRAIVNGLPVSGLGILIALPITMIKAIVSPKARPMPRMTAAIRPDRDAGKMTLQIVCQ